MKISRRDFLAAGSATCAGLTLPFYPGVAAGQENDDPLRWVDLFVATGGHGHCYPGATVPFGAVQLSPDTFNAGWDWCSGYHRSDSSIMGFSHTHLSGTGCGDLLDFLVMAGVGSVKLTPGPRDKPEMGYRSRFDHSAERAEPGYYTVLLKDYNIQAELTATERTGLHRYTFPASTEAYLIVDLNHCFEYKITSAELHQLDETSIAGGHVTHSWAIGRQAFFALQVSKMPDRIEFYQDDKLVSAKKLAGTNLKAVFRFTTHANEEILVKTGISGVSSEGAMRNLQAEQHDWDFEKVRRSARDQWRTQLAKISVQTANQAHKRTFYSAMYHLSLGPTLFDDVDGRYRGMDGQVHQLESGAHNYSTYSLWDCYRAAYPLFTMIEPERVPQLVNTLIRMAEESPEGMPVWPLHGCETGCMTGYHSASFMADAILKGFPGIDVQRAYACMRRRALVDDYRGLGYFRRLHYIPADREPESVSKSFEYCYGAWAVAHVAKKLGRDEDAATLLGQASNYRNYFNPATGFMQPRLEAGAWAEPFDPKAMGHSPQWRDFTESNSWQTTFGIQHDVQGVVDLFGGREAFVKKLDALFNQSSDLPPDAPPDIAGMVGQYAHGNEPSHHIAYLYVYAGAPQKTQPRVRSLMETMYAPTPDGMQGNEDVGQMSAWFMLSALGFYSVDPVSGVYVIGSPLFDSAVVQMGGGRELRIEVVRPSPDDVYVHAISLNGASLDRLWFRHSEIVMGGRLTFRMGPLPSPTFGVGDGAVVPPHLVRKV